MYCTWWESIFVGPAQLLVVFDFVERSTPRIVMTTRQKHHDYPIFKPRRKGKGSTTMRACLKTGVYPNSRALSYIIIINWKYWRVGRIFLRNALWWRNMDEFIIQDGSAPHGHEDGDGHGFGWKNMGMPKSLKKIVEVSEELKTESKSLS